MTSAIRRAAGALSILESVWLVYVQFAVTVTACPANGCPGPQFIPLYSPLLIGGLVAALLVDGLLGIWGSWFAYPAGALLSAVVLIITGYSVWTENGYAYLINESYQALFGAILAAVALLVSLIAWRSKNVLSEQANPMNLPVFG
jgi:hypothetical protein